jgi:hypothetical protein
LKLTIVDMSKFSVQRLQKVKAGTNGCVLFLSVGNIASWFEGGMLFIAVVSSGPAVGSVVQSQVLVTEKK